MDRGVEQGAQGARPVRAAVPRAPGQGRDAPRRDVRQRAVGDPRRPVGVERLRQAEAVRVPRLGRLADRVGRPQGEGGAREDHDEGRQDDRRGVQPEGAHLRAQDPAHRGGARAGRARPLREVRYRRLGRARPRGVPGRARAARLRPERARPHLAARLPRLRRRRHREPRGVHDVRAAPRAARLLAQRRVPRRLPQEPRAGAARPLRPEEARAALPPALLDEGAAPARHPQVQAGRAQVHRHPVEGDRHGQVGPHRGRRVPADAREHLPDDGRQVRAARLGGEPRARAEPRGRAQDDRRQGRGSGGASARRRRRRSGRRRPA